MKVRLIIKLPRRRQSQSRPDSGELARIVPPPVDWPLPIDEPSANKPSVPSAWAVDTGRLRSECSHQLLLALAEEAMAGFAASPAGGPEVGGVLYGACDGACLRIASYRSLACEHVHGPDFDLSENDEQEFKNLLADPASSLAPVGWYFSQFTNLRLTPQAIALHERHFPEPWQVILVLGRFRLQPLRVGIFVRDRDGRLNPEPEHEFAIGTDWRIGPSRETGSASAATLRAIK